MARICPSCGKGQNYDADFCGNCGTQIADALNQNSSQIQPNQLQQNDRRQDAQFQSGKIKSNKKVAIVTALLMIPVIVIAVVVISVVINDTPSNNNETTVQNGQLSEKAQIIMDATGLTTENTKEAEEAFNQVSGNISVIYSVTYDDGLDNLACDGSKGYRIKTEFSNNVILHAVDGKIHSIRYADTDYWIDGKVQAYFYDMDGKLITRE